MEGKYDLYDFLKEYGYYVRNNDLDGQMRSGYKWYMNDDDLYPQLNPLLFKDSTVGSIKLMAWDVSLRVGALNSMINYFDTIGDYKEANDLTEVKEKIKKSFRAMVNILRVTKPQLN